MANNSGDYVANRTETLDELNARFASALLPLTVTFGLFAVFGIAGNVLILLVFTFSREYRRNIFKIFVITLGIIDTITCMTLIPAEMVKQQHYFDFSDASTCQVKCFFNVFGACSSCMALLVISVDRFRKVVQPMRKQLSPKVAVWTLFFAAFVFPITVAVPGTMMCGIQKANKTNIYGEKTEIFLCSASDEFRFSVWRKVYKFSLTFLFAGISVVYVILYSFVMREAIKQLRTLSAQRKNSFFEVTYSSDIYDPNAIVDQHHRRASLKSQEDEHLTNPITPPNNGSSHSVKEGRAKKASRQFSMRSLRSMRGHLPLLQRAHFPSKTIIWFILTIVFIVTYLTHNVLSLYVGEVVKMAPGRFSVYSFFFRIYFVNHIINPLVYAIFVKRFRTSCRTLLPTIKRHIAECCS